MYYIMKSDKLVCMSKTVFYFGYYIIFNSLFNY